MARMLLTFLLLSPALLGQDLAYIDAVGHGRFANIRGGRVIFVDNLNSSGAGSLKAAFEDSSGARIVIPRVGGFIDSNGNIGVDNDSLYYLGSASLVPIVLRNHGIIIRASHVVIDGHVGMIGDQWDSFETAPIQASGRDNIQIGGAAVPRFVSIVNCEVFYSLDENMSTFAESHQLTWYRNAFSQPINDSYHPTGTHAYNLLLHQSDNDSVTIYQNVFESQKSRGPKFGLNTEVELVNNVMYNWLQRATNMDSAVVANIIGNDYRQGPENPGGGNTPPIYLSNSGSDPNNDGRQLYLSGNIDDVLNTSDNGSTNWVMTNSPADSTLNKVSSPAAAQSGLTVLPAGDVWTTIKPNVGRLHLGQQDSMIAAMIARIDGNTAGIKDTTSNAWPAEFYDVDLDTVSFYDDSDDDGMWDTFEVAFGSDPNTNDINTLYLGYEYWQHFAYYAKFGTVWASLAESSTYNNYSRYQRY